MAGMLLGRRREFQRRGANLPVYRCDARRSSPERPGGLPRSHNLPAVRYFALVLLIAAAAPSSGQRVADSAPGQFMLSEDIGLPMNKAQVMAAAQDAWGASFGQEPGAQLTLVDPDNGLIEGSARMNYRSKMLMGREETMGTVTYQVTVQAKNGQCHIRVHNLLHTGNRGAKGGGINAGTLMEGTAPDEHYEGVSLGMSRRMHADIRDVATTRIREAMRRFAARMRLLGGE